MDCRVHSTKPEGAYQQLYQRILKRHSQFCFPPCRIPVTLQWLTIITHTTDGVFRGRKGDPDCAEVFGIIPDCIVHREVYTFLQLMRTRF